ncbi:ABC-F family ATP-binding cassette domain-containing protein [Shimia aestuarii]|uniref:ABC-F family ATP-binding cassette domain-containing protein n=1 Tax=Shimia aestuarii TaxID=254406 RepID=UPI001FB278DB|nr:ABC-F family ATP-binding cassette domain-containing protein [Shimia aestuarii]
MPASLTLSELSFSTTDGNPLFKDISLSFGAERTGLVGRNGAGKSTLLHLLSGDLNPTSGQVRATGSVAMMRQEAMAHADATIADLFGVREATDLLARAEAGRASVEDMAEADWTLPMRLEAALVRVGLAVQPQTPLRALSGGEQSRAALAALLFAEPDILLLDEPTNNLDREGRQAVLEVLRGWTGGAIIASHDRALLEEMDAIVELSSLGAARYGGGYSAYRASKALELEAAARDLAHAEQAQSEAARRAQQATERKARTDRMGQRARAKGTQPKIVMDAAKERSEASGGAGKRLREARREAADEAVEAARAAIEVLQPIHMEIASTGLPLGRTVLRVDQVSGGYETQRPVIRGLSLTVTGPERIAIEGANGSGKTTLLKLITGALAPSAGAVDLRVPYALLDQHVGMLAPHESLRDGFLRRNPTADRHMAHEALARFGFRAEEALRQVRSLSGGERLRAGLACTLGGKPPPSLLILDEPTNHLDLEGVEALETALAAYDGAVLVVSHDRAFLRALSPDRVLRLGA